MRMFFGVLLLIVFQTFSSVVFAQSTDWQGFFMEGRLGYGSGDHTLGYEYPGEAPVSHSLPVDGSLYGAAVGYRYQFDHWPVTLGVVFAAEQGSVVGLEQTIAPEGWVRLRYEADRFYMLGLQAGYVFRKDWLLYGTYGVVGGKMAIAADAYYTGDSAAKTERGWVLGEYYEIGVSRRFSRGWYAGAAIQSFDFTAHDSVRFQEYDGGSLSANVSATVVKAVVGYQW